MSDDKPEPAADPTPDDVPQETDQAETTAGEVPAQAAASSPPGPPPPGPPPPGPPPGHFPPPPRQSWWDRVLTMRGVVAVALASLVIGGFGGAAVTAAVSHLWRHDRDHWYHEGWRDGRMGPGRMGPGQMGPGQWGPGNGWDSRPGGSDVPIPTPAAPEGSSGPNSGNG